MACDALKEHREWFTEHREALGLTGEGEAPKKKMVFISHAIEDTDYVIAFADFLRLSGLREDTLYCLSYVDYCVPTGEEIYEFLRHNFADYELLVVFLLSGDHYYKCVPCLHEMGAAWVSGAKSYSLLLPGMSLDMMKGSIDSRSIAIKLDSEEAYSRPSDLMGEIVTFLNIEGPSQNVWNRDYSAFLEKVRGISPAKV